MTRTIEERLSEQRDELLSLQSIYGEDIVSYKTQNCWKQECPLEVTIRIKPQAAEVYVHLDVSIICGSDYPENVPQITLQNVVELSHKETQELKQILLAEAKKCIGMAMIFDLCQIAQQFLSERNRKPVLSEHEKMLNKVAEKEIEQRRQRIDSVNREMEEVAAENERRRTEKLDRENDDCGVERRTRLQTHNLGELGECEVVEMLHPNYGFGVGEERRIYQLSKLKSPRPPAHKFAVEWMAFDQVNQMLVTEWRFEFTLGRKQQRKLPNNIDFAPFEKKLEMFARLANQKLSSLLVEDQQFFAAYAFVNFKRCAASSPTNFNCKLLVGQTTEPDDKCLASTPIFDSICQNSKKYAPQLAAQAVCALKWLHGQGFYHGHLSAYSTWMLNRQIFRLSDYFLMPKLIGLCAEFEKLTSGSEYNALAEQTIPKRQSRDLFALGKLLDSILGLEKVTVDPMTDGAINSNNEDAADFIRLCESADDVEQLIDHKYLVHDLTRPSNDLSVESTKLSMRLDTLGNSRLTKDFQVYQYLGKGGFGDVFLARNKLDDNDYAIKRIPLNPRSNRLNQRIKREAKLFSRLNHEHVVRFYAAWLESIPIVAEAATDTTTTTTATTPSTDAQSNVRSSRKSRMGQLKTVRELSDGKEEDELSSSSDTSSSSDAEGGGGKFFRRKTRPGVPAADSVSDATEFSSARQPPQNVQTLFSHHTLQSKSAAGNSEFDVVFYDEDEEEDDGPFFQKASGEERANPLTDGGATEARCESPKWPPAAPKTQQILYIQMEYCKNSTLRAFIDSGRLHGDSPTIWRLFREILSGLQYIHHQNMIHRDIKPMNIFLDSNWSVKIGDFGLATHDAFGTVAGAILSENKLPILGSNDVGFTKDVGTAMYIAPEIEGRSPTAGKFYTSKIDVYSVGIVMFEMVHRPPVTSSERFAVLQRLRADVQLPDDFAVDMTVQQRAATKKLIAWMLKTDPAERPTVDEILHSEVIPCISYEDDDFQKTALQVLRKRNGRQYKQLIGTLFNEQGISPALDYCFDQTTCINEFESRHRTLIMDRLRQELKAILHLHTFTPVPTHLLSCRRPVDASGDSNNGAMTVDIRNAAAAQKQYTLIDCSGLPVNLPRNLRHNFIRYCARNGVSQMKRYEFGKVFEHADCSGGIHPIERNECCVDLIGPALHRNFIAAECIATSVEIIRKCAAFEGLKWTLVVGHTDLIRAACLQQNISDGLTQGKVLETLHNFSTKKKKMTIERKSEFLAGYCGITNQLAVSLLRTLEIADDFASFSDHLRSLSRSKLETVRHIARDALDEIAKTIASVRQLCAGVKNENFLFDAGLSYRPQTFGGAFTYFLRVDVFHQGSVRPVTVLAGGAYDAALTAERRAQDPAPSWPLCAYGFNFSMEDLVQLYCLRGLEKFDMSPCCVLVCSTSDELAKAKYDMTLKFWELGVSADVIHESPTSVYSVLEYCEKHSIHILVVLLKVDEAVVYMDESVGPIAQSSSISSVQQQQQQQQYAKRSSALLGYRIAQNKIGYDEAVRFVLTARNERLAAHPQALFCTSGKSMGGSDLTTVGAASASDGCGGILPNSTLTASLANLNVNFAMEERPSHNMRKKIETQLRNVLISELLPKLSAKTHVEVIVTELSPDVLRQFAAYVERVYESDSHLSKAVEVFQNAHKVTGRHKSALKTLVDALQPFLCGEHTSRAGPVDMTGLASSGDFAAGQTDVTVLVLWCKQIAPTSNIFYRVIV